MTDDQIQALEALGTAAKGRNSTLVDLKRVALPILSSTLDDLVKQEFIRTVGPGDFTVTPLGLEQAIENRKLPPADG